MKLKEYLNFLVSRRKSNASSKSHKPKSHHQSISSTDCHYEICGYDDVNRVPMDNHHSRTEMLLTRHAQLVNTIIGIRSQENLCSSCPHCRILHQSQEKNLSLNHNYSSTLATSNPRREYQQNQTIISSSNNSLWTKTRQRSKIRTNPWINTIRTSQPEYFIHDPKLSSTLIHSESFPQTISNGNIHSINPSNIVLHQSDSGHGFSLSSSRVIDSSSPDNTSIDGPLLDEKQHGSYTNHVEQYFPSKATIPSDKKRKIRPIQSRYQRSLNTRISSSPKKSINRNYHSRSSSPRLSNDHFSIEFEEIVENEHSHKQKSSIRKSPFILPLDETDVKLSSPLPTLYSTATLKKTNSRVILNHIEEIENEIRMMTTLNFDHDEHMHSSNIYPKENEKKFIQEQVNQWVEQCLTTNKNNNSTNLLHTQCDNLSNTLKDYVVCVCPNDNDKASILPKSQNKTELMTAFYLSSIPTIKRTFSLLDQSLQQSKSRTMTKDFKFMHECPF
ncbi:unnamed protein product [Rotaria sp. Silwood2]|nr:unnamed protein product [Rotaria sp. Silwood2]CAF2577981.1 unnamed protein product [Rotaria sp. Silwood2]CAF2825087.1 unnamed protein product [Rotaria sp. Silwood2]CAF2986105.1 unnamed protein product [Rotaria sp. Silwood2]CAF4138760.1 unnamed protein product [Rotaria sp. Silwood2]